LELGKTLKKISFTVLLILIVIGSYNLISASTKKTVKIWIFGDSTVKDYTDHQDECSPAVKIAGWGEFMKDFLRTDSLDKVRNVITADSVVVDNRANGGRAARTYISGTDTAVLRYAYANMNAGDYMFIQFGHNDEADCVNYPDRCTTIPDFKKYIGMYVDTVLSKKAMPVLITPMVRNAWPEYNTHDNSDGSKTNQQVGNFSLALQQVAKEKGVPCIDLTQRSIDLFNNVGDDATKYQYFRKVRAGTNLPSGCSSVNDGTHFQPYGAKELARQIFLGLQSLYEVKVTISDTSKGSVTGYSNGVKDKANKNFIQLQNDFSKGSGWYENTYNSTVKISAVPKKRCRFTGWSGDITGTTNPLTISINKSYKIQANFLDSSATFVSFDDNPVIISNNRTEFIGNTNNRNYVYINLSQPAFVDIILFDLNGKVTLSYQKKRLAGGKNIIELPNTARGIHFISLRINNKLISNKIMIRW
jgi:lysophospholipase L1-like esterase